MVLLPGDKPHSLISFCSCKNVYLDLYFFVNWRDSAIPLFVKANIPPLNIMYCQSVANLVYIGGGRGGAGGAPPPPPPPPTFLQMVFFLHANARHSKPKVASRCRHTANVAFDLFNIFLYVIPRKVRKCSLSPFVTSNVVLSCLVRMADILVRLEQKADSLSALQLTGALFTINWGTLCQTHRPPPPFHPYPLASVHPPPPPPPPPPTFRTASRPLVYDVVNENCPKNIRQLFLSIKDIHSYETHSAANGKLYTRPSRLKPQLNSFKRSGTIFWNSLPKSVKDSPKFSFKKKKRYEILFSLCSNKKRTILNSKELHRFLQNIAFHAEF